MFEMIYKIIYNCPDLISVYVVQNITKDSMNMHIMYQSKYNLT